MCVKHSHEREKGENNWAENTAKYGIGHNNWGTRQFCFTFKLFIRQLLKKSQRLFLLYIYVHFFYCNLWIFIHWNKLELLFGTLFV